MVRTEFFGSGPRSILTCLQLVFAIGGAGGFVVGLIEIAPLLAFEESPVSQLEFYLWFTFTTSALLLGSVVFLAQRLVSAHRREAHLSETLGTRLQRQRQLSEQAMLIQHHMAESVRRAADKGLVYDAATALEHVLGDLLRRYLRDRLGSGFKFHVTVKSIRGKDEEDRYILTDLYRDADQLERIRPRRQDELLDGNYVYETFLNAPKESERQVHIADTETSHIPGSFRARARARGYRSVLALPLNFPARSEERLPGVATGLMGFLGIDSPTPHVFDELFDQREEASSVPEPREELHVLYGLADAVATVILLRQEPAPRPQPQPPREVSDATTTASG